MAPKGAQATAYLSTISRNESRTSVSAGEYAPSMEIKMPAKKRGYKIQLKSNHSYDGL